jgi:monothiol glutaredoxin
MSIEQFIENEVKSNDVVLFMKGTPQFPQCGFSGQVVQILDHVGVGGCDIIREMFQAGELQQLLADKGVTVAASASA